MAGVRGVIAVPVYQWWFRTHRSKHEALFTSTGYQPEHNHFEVSPVRGPVPIFQKFTSNVMADRQAMALQGQDFGPFAPHLVVPPDNALLGLTMAGSSFRWPFTAQRRIHNKRSICAYQWGLIPFQHCHGRQKKEQSGGKPEAASKAAKRKATAADVAADFKQNIPGFAVAMMWPTSGMTVDLVLSPWDFVIGAGQVLLSMTLNVAWKRIRSGAPKAGDHVKVFQGCKRIPRSLVQTGAWRYARDKIVDNAARDVIKGILTNGEIGAPFKLAKFNLETGKLSVWTYEKEIGWKLSDTIPLDPRGWKLFADKPTTCEGPEEGGMSYQQPPPTPKADASPQEQAPHEQPKRDERPKSYSTIQDQWTQPEPEDQLGPYDPKRGLLEDLLEGVPHAL